LFAVANLGGLPPNFRSPQPAKLCKYSVARTRSRFRRILGIPNPLHFLPLCETIFTNWASIAGLLALSPICKSTPTRHPHKNRAVSPKFDRGALHGFQAFARAGCRASLTADIADFYPSVYTHSIAWACHSKAVAKANREMALFGNKLDKIIRDAQDGQTMGIPIGPDTSFIIAEVVLAACDHVLSQKAANLTGLRWLDEWELLTRDRGEAENILATLQQNLLEYELRLNPRKTSLSDLPVEFDPEWLAELRAFMFRASAIGQANDLTRYFDLMTDHLKRNPDQHIVKYGLGRIRALPPHASNMTLFQALIFQAATFEPSAIKEAIQAIYHAETNHGLTVNHQLLQLTVNRVAAICARVGHHYELSWCLWAAINWGLTIDPAVAAEISAIDNSIVAILALDANQLGLFGGHLNLAIWQARMDQRELHEQEWLLAYEANVQGWLPSVGGGDHVAADVGFRVLKNANVRFYHRSASPFTPGALAYP
jgi:hypothetical protein